MGNPGYGFIEGETPPPYIKQEEEEPEPQRPNGQLIDLPADGPPEEPATAQPHHEGLRADGHLMALPENLPPVDPVYANVEQVYYCG